ncbi:MAG TPA: NAD(P)-dependent oxidoreductase [Stellaceae bacterium]|nr:NAD(P)-dependent oxidoreductase [Stellaceae bacterium]
MERLGFIGLGVMGTPMAGHLAAAGYGVTVFDLDPARAASLAARHATIAVATAPKGVAAASDIVITMLPSGREVREVALGADGLLAGFAPGGLLLDTSSAEPWLTREVAARLGEHGIALVDAPVSGAEAGAKAAELVFMVGGAAADVARVEPLLAVLGKQYFHLGPVGSGHVMKAINNLISAATLMATTEGLIAGTRAGLDPEVMNDVIDVCTAGSWISRTQFRRHIFNRRYDDAFRLALMMKDVTIAGRIAADSALDLPLSQTAQRLWAEIQAHAPADASLSDLVRALETSTGVELKGKASGG